jgi:Calcineurin-like phosphoesterase
MTSATDRDSQTGGAISSRATAAATGYRCARPGTYAHLMTWRDRPLSWSSPSALWRSRNDQLVRRFGDPTNDTRRAWVAGQLAAGADPDFTVRTGDADAESASFVVIGDTGEGDGSQYAVVPGLLQVAADTDFMYVLSDVVYPAGGIDEYEEKFFHPYESYPGPIYAVPGNHDWYDGLTGFMFHFCGVPWERRPAGVAGPGSGWKRTLRRWLWRDPPPAHAEAVERMRRMRPKPTQQSSQPGPYFAIDTGPVLLVGIDTGILGDLDAEQGEWLRRISASPKPKILLTGKPLYVDGQIHPGPIEGGGTVDEIVRDAKHNYIASIGGDIHNYQRYPVRLPDGRTLLYLVSGGGGAFMSGTHRIPKVELPGISEDEFRCYPLRGDSLFVFCRNYGRILSGGRLGHFLRFGRLISRFFVIPPDEASAFMAERLGLATTRTAARAVKISRHTRFVANWIFPLPGAIHGLFQPLYSTLLDWNDPPMFKNFLRIDATKDTITITCYAATGCGEQETEPPVEDKLRATRDAAGQWTWSELGPS